MTLASYDDWSETAADNIDIGGISIAEGMKPSAVNNAFRELMAQLKTANFAPFGIVPVGAGMDYFDDTAPDGWLWRDGSAVSRTTYSALFAKIGTTYGDGDGSTTFNLPDDRGRVTAGKDDMGGTAASRLTSDGSGVDGSTLGATGGDETHTLTEAELAAHGHTFSGTTSTDGSHKHDFTFSDSSVDAPNFYNFGGGHVELMASNANTKTGQLGMTTAGSHSHTYSGTAADAGSGDAHNNVQPTLVCNKIIFTGVFSS